MVLFWSELHNYCYVIMGAMASKIISLTIVYSIVHSGADQRKHQSSASLAFVRGIHRWTVNSPLKCPVTQKMFPFDDVIRNYVVPGDLYSACLLFFCLHERNPKSVLFCISKIEFVFGNKYQCKLITPLPLQFSTGYVIINQWQYL